jgi:hypothetical protein
MVEVSGHILGLPAVEVEAKVSGVAWQKQSGHIRTAGEAEVKEVNGKIWRKGDHIP